MQSIRPRASVRFICIYTVLLIGARYSQCQSPDSRSPNPVSLPTSVFLSHDELHALLSAKGSKPSDELVGTSYFVNSSAMWQEATRTIPYTHVQTLLAAHIHSRQYVAALKSNTSLRIGHEVNRLDLYTHLSPNFTTGDHQVQLTSVVVSSETDLLYLETALLEEKFDAFVPMRLSLSRKILKHHNIDFLESHFGVSIPVPPLVTTESFEDKAIFANWIAARGLSDYIPAVYATEADISRFPVCIKVPTACCGRGVYIANNNLDVANAVTDINKLFNTKILNTNVHIFQEAIESTVEISPNFIAYRGELLGMLCAINRQRSELTIVAMVDDESEKNYPIDCADLEKITALYDMTRRIVEQSNYNGFGVINLKLVPGTMGKAQLEHYLNSIPIIQRGSASVVTADFSAAHSSLDANELESVPKMFEINPRIGGPLYRKYVGEQALMVELYMKRASEATTPV